MYDQSSSTIKGKIVLCLYSISHVFYSDLCPDLVYNLWALASLLRKKIVIWTLSSDLWIPELPKSSSYSAKQTCFTLFMNGWYYTLQRTQCLWQTCWEFTPKNKSSIMSQCSDENISAHILVPKFRHCRGILVYMLYTWDCFPGLV